MSLVLRVAGASAELEPVEFALNVSQDVATVAIEQPIVAVTFMVLGALVAELFRRLWRFLMMVEALLEANEFLSCLPLRLVLSSLRYICVQLGICEGDTVTVILITKSMLKTASSSSSDNVAVQQDLVYHSSDTCRCLYSGQHALFRQCRFCKV